MMPDAGKKSIGKVRCAYRLEARRVREPYFPYPQKAITCTKDLVEFAHALVDSDIEKMIALYLDAQNQLIGLHIQPGTVNESYIYPREIVKNALLNAASCMVLIHNHPSGVTRPSDADIRITKVVREAAGLFQIMVHDHLIISESGWFSFREEGLMN